MKFYISKQAYWGSASFFWLSVYSTKPLDPCTGIFTITSVVSSVLVRIKSKRATLSLLPLLLEKRNCHKVIAGLSNVIHLKKHETPSINLENWSHFFVSIATTVFLIWAIIISPKIKLAAAFQLVCRTHFVSYFCPALSITASKNPTLSFLPMAITWFLAIPVIPSLLLSQMYLNSLMNWHSSLFPSFHTCIPCLKYLNLTYFSVLTWLTPESLLFLNWKGTRYPKFRPDTTLKAHEILPPPSPSPTIYRPDHTAF
jgi:hypothetical protein